MNIFSGYISQLILVMFLAIAAYLGMQARNIYRKYVTTEIKQSVCRTVVRFVEQVYTDLHGKEKLEQAMKRASLILADYGIQISEQELVSIIEAAVNEFNNSFNKDEDPEALRFRALFLLNWHPQSQECVVSAYRVTDCACYEFRFRLSGFLDVLSDGGICKAGRLDRRSGSSTIQAGKNVLRHAQTGGSGSGADSSAGFFLHADCDIVA